MQRTCVRRHNKYRGETQTLSSHILYTLQDFHKYSKHSVHVFRAVEQRSHAFTLLSDSSSSDALLYIQKSSWGSWTLRATLS